MQLVTEFKLECFKEVPQGKAFSALFMGLACRM